MLLALDAGNTNVTAGVFSGKRLVHRFRIETAGATAGSLARAYRTKARAFGARIDAAVFGSVVPGLDPALRRSLFETYGVRAVQVGPASRLGMRLRVRASGEVGADRILNALGAFERTRGAAVVIDFGTATTFDCVGRTGDYLGGAILPGPNLAAGALHEHTAKLPRVPVARPRRVVGKDTVECIQAGIYFGYLGMIEKVLKLTLSEMRAAGEGGRIPVLATGGLAALFKSELPGGGRLAPDLTLEGLRIAFHKLTGMEA